MNLDTSKYLGGIGALLVFIGVLPIFTGSGALSLIGFILVLIAAKGLADYYKEGGIFNNALYGVIVAIVGAVVAVAVAFIALVTFFTNIGISLMNIQDWSALSAIDWQTVSSNVLGSFLGSVLLVVALVWIFAIIAAIFIRKALGLISAKSGVGMFGTAGILILVGAIIPLLGLILIWIAMLLLAVAFFSVRPSPQQPMQPATQV
jgi:uncharacterized membrane protein